MKKMRGLISLFLSIATLLSLVTVFAMVISGNESESLGGVSFDVIEPSGDIEKMSYVTYKNEQDYLLDIADGSFDGMIDGSFSIDASNSASGTTKLQPPTEDGEYYVVMLSDLYIEGTVKLAKEESLTINLGGNTLAIKGTFDIGSDSSAKVSTEFTIKNGELDLVGTEGSVAQLFSARIGASFTLDGVVARRNENADYIFLIQDSLSSITFRNTELYDDGAVIFNIRPTYPGTNCTCNTAACKEARKSGGGKPLDVKHTLDGFIYHGGSKALFTIEKAGKHDDTTPFYTVMDIEIKGNSEIDTSVWFGFSKDSTVNEASQITLKVEEGTRFTARSLPAADKAPYKTVLVDKNGAELDGEIFGNSGRADFPLQLGTGEVKVTWYNSNGTQLQSLTCVKGAAPEFSGSVTPPQRVAITDGEVLMYVHNGWSFDKDNLVPQQIKPITEDTSIYACFTLVSPSIVEYSEDGIDIVNAYLEPKLTRELFESVSDGAYLIALADLKTEKGGELFATRSFTLDLRGRTLSITEDSASILTPDKDVTLTVKRGTVYSSGISAVKSQGMGSVILSDVRLRGDGVPAISLSSGTVSLRRGSLDFAGTSVDTSAVLLGSGVGKCRFEIYGTEINLSNSLGAQDFIRAEGARAMQGGADIEVLFAKDGDTSPTVSVVGELITVSSDTARKLSLSVIADGIDFTDRGALFGFGESENASCEVSIKLLNGAKVAAQDASVIFDVEPGYTVLRPKDPTGPVVILEKDLRAYVSLSVWNSLTLNLYVPKDSDVDFIEIYEKTVFDVKDKDTYITSTYGDGYVCYKVPCEEITANIAAISFSLRLGVYLEDGAKCYKEIEYSIVNDYCKPIIEGDYADEAKDLVYSVLSYMRAASELFGTDGIYLSSEEWEALEALLVDYVPDLPTDTECDLSSASGAISGIQYELSDGLHLILNISESKRDLPIKLTVGDRIVYDSDSCAEGIIRAAINFYDVNEAVTVVIGNESFTFDFAWYAEALTENYSDSKIQAAVYAVYDLGVRAYAYEQLLLGTDVPDTPVITPDFD